MVRLLDGERLLSAGAPVPQGRWVEVLSGTSLEWPAGCSASLAAGTVARLSEGAIELRQGRLEWSGTPRRGFRARAGEVLVQVLGTTFSLVADHDSVEVAVSEGVVELAWSGGRRRLAAGAPPWELPDERSPSPPDASPTGPGGPRSGSTARGHETEGGRREAGGFVSGGSRSP